MIDRDKADDEVFFGNGFSVLDRTGNRTAYELHGEDELVQLPVVDSDELAAALAVLTEGGELILSLREKQAFQLVVREGVSYGAASKIMSKGSRRPFSKSAVQMSVKRAGAKLQKLCAARLRE